MLLPFSPGWRNTRQSRIEALERRVLFSDIRWTNEGGGLAGDSDDFEEVYGANATVARAIVNRAISDWERVIENFNRAPGDGNFFDLNIDADVFSSSTIAGQTSLITSVDGKPISADIDLDDNGGGIGSWYFDPVIGSSMVPDDGEFTSLVTPFAATGSAPTAGNDFYRTVSHEIGHAMGIAGGWFLEPLRIDDFLTAAGTDPIDGTSTLYAFNVGGGPVEATFTDAGGYHFFEGPAMPGLPAHPDELLNSGRTASSQLRRLISDVLVITLQQAYGYTVKLPSQINTLYANLNTTTDVLRVAGNGNENVTIDMVGGNIRVQVNAMSELFPASEVSSIVVDGGGGADTLTINSLTANKPVTFNGGVGNDTLVLAANGQNLDAIQSSITFNDPGAAGDSIVLHDGLNAAAGTTYTINNAGNNFDRTNFPFLSFTSIQNFTLHAGSNQNVINVHASPPTLTTTINAGGGNDQINLALASQRLNNLAGPVLVNGDAGTNDSITLMDNLSTENDNYTMSGNQVQHPAFGGLTYGTIENASLLASGGQNSITISSTPAGTTWGIDAGAGIDQISIQSSVVGSTLNVNAGPGNDNIDLAMASGNLADLRGALTINGQADADDLTLWDNLATGNDAYSVTSTNVDRAVFSGVTYGTVETLQLLAQTGNNTIDISSTAGGTTTTISANSGNDIFNVGTPGNTAASIAGPLVLRGEVGTDTVFYTDQSNAVATTYGITSTTITRSGAAMTTFATVELLDLRGGSSNDTYVVSSTLASCPVVISGANGDDDFFLGGVIGSAVFLDNILGALTLNGQNGSDEVVMNDGISNASDSYTITPTAFTHPGTGGMTYATMEGMTLLAASGANLIDVSTAALCPVTVHSRFGTDTINVNETALNAPVTVGTSPGDDTVNVNPGGAGTAFALFNDTQRIGALSIFAGGTASIAAGGNRVLTATSINLSGSGVLDMNDNDVIVDYTGASPLAAITARLASGYSAGTWNGPGINSSAAAASGNTAIGVAEATDLFSTFPATFSGQQIDNTAVLLRYTPYGDADLNGAVNSDDFNRLAANFGQAAKRWTHGNFNFDAAGAVNSDDFNLLAGNFGAIAGDAASLPQLTRSGDDREELLPASA